MVDRTEIMRQIKTVARAFIPQSVTHEEWETAWQKIEAMLASAPPVPADGIDKEKTS